MIEAPDHFLGQEGLVLECLRTHPAMTMRSIAEWATGLGFAQPRTNYFYLPLKRLMATGMIARKGKRQSGFLASDKKAFLYSLTDAGRSRAESNRALLASVFSLVVRSSD